MNATETTKSKPYHSSLEATAKAILIDPKAPHKYFQMIGIARLAAATSLPPTHRDDAKMFWKNLRADVKKGTPGSSMLIDAIGKTIDAIEAQKFEMANGATHPAYHTTAQPQQMQQHGAGRTPQQS